MSAPMYEFTFEVSLDLLQRAMVAWARPYRTRSQKLRRFGLVLLVGAAVGVGIILTGVLDYVSNGMLIGMLIGFYVGLVFWFVMHRRDVKRLSAYSARLLEKQGPTQVRISSDGIVLTSQLASTTAEWAIYDQVIEMSDASALRSGAMVYPLPHDALPEGVDPATFHADLVRWQREGSA